jgi:hypothetical protein
VEQVTGCTLAGQEETVQGVMATWSRCAAGIAYPAMKEREGEGTSPDRVAPRPPTLLSLL